MPDLTEDPLWWARSDSRVVMALDRLGCALFRQLPPGAFREKGTSRWRSLVHRGASVTCTVCGRSFRHFAPRWNAPNVICWNCRAEERHRMLWLFLTRIRPDLLSAARSLLHFAPEPGLEAHLRRIEHLHYVRCDIDPPPGALRIDITQIALPDASFQAIICSHVLEHVPDDELAMRELHRVLAPGGWCLVMVPLDPALEETYEDPSVTDPAERVRHFWQEDHVRLYGPDIALRLRGAGFEAERLLPADLVSPAELERFQLGGMGSDIFLCRKPAEL